MESDLKVICLGSDAFYELVHKVSDLVREKYTEEVLWINEEKAQELLNVKAKSTMQLLRDQGKVKYSQPQKKMILYHKPSLLAYLEKHSKNPF